MNKKLMSLLSVAVIALSTGCAGGNSTNTTPNINTTSNTHERDIFERPTEDGWYEFVDEVGNEYEGQFVNGLYHGFGTMLYTTATIYEGTWYEGKMDGSGKIYWDSGCLYVGEMKNDLMHGSGYMLYPMGDYYYGEFRDGQITGYGTKAFLRDSTAATHQQKYDIYTGQMLNSLLHGYGTMVYSFGGVYTGEFANNVKSGYGTYVWEKTDDPLIPWAMFEGYFANDWISGQGTLYFKDGTSMTGYFDGNALPLFAN